MAADGKWRSGPNGGRQFEFQADLEPVTAHVAAQHHNAHGGSSFYVHSGSRPTRGYAVGGLPGVPEAVHNQPHITPEQFQENRDRIRAALPHTASAVAGSWAEAGRSVMDGSNTVPDRRAARTLQGKRNERAVFNISKGQEENLSG